MSETAIQLTDSDALRPMDMIQKAFLAAIDRGGPEALAVADRILEQMAKQRDYEDCERFNAALRRIQDKLKPIVKTGYNPQTRSPYATAEGVDAAIEDLMMEEEMSLSFVPKPSDKADMVLIVGILSLGAYSREYPLEMPADGKGPQGGGVMSRTHATGAAITYAKRYLKNMIFNLRFKEKDTDGNGAEGGEAMPDGTVDEYLDALGNAPDLDSLKSLFSECWQKAKKLGDSRAKKAFQDKYESAKRRMVG